MSPSTSPSTTGHLAGFWVRDIRHVLIACAALALVFAVGLSIGTWSGSPTPASRPAAGRPAGLDTGRIVFMPMWGNVCRQMLIDNATWQLTENGTVDCSALDSSGQQPGQPGSAADRLQGLRSGFGTKR